MRQWVVTRQWRIILIRSLIRLTQIDEDGVKSPILVNLAHVQAVATITDPGSRAMGHQSNVVLESRIIAICESVSDVEAAN